MRGILVLLLGMLCVEVAAFLCGQNGDRVKAAMCKALTSAGLSEEDAEQCTGKYDEWECIVDSTRVVTCVGYSLNSADSCENTRVVCAGQSDTYGTLDQQAALVHEVIKDIRNSTAAFGCHPRCPMFISTNNCSTQQPSSSPSVPPATINYTASSAPTVSPTSPPTISPSLEVLRNISSAGVWKYLAYLPGGFGSIGWSSQLGKDVLLGEFLRIEQNQLVLNVTQIVKGRLTWQEKTAKIGADAEVRQICDTLINGTISYNSLYPSPTLQFPKLEDVECMCNRRKTLDILVRPLEMGGCGADPSTYERYRGYQDCVTLVSCDCKVSNWSANWDACNVPEKSCGTVGLKNRTRIVLEPWSGSGRRCPELVQYDACEGPACSRQLGDHWWDWLAVVVAPVVCVCWLLLLWYRVCLSPDTKALFEKLRDSSDKSEGLVGDDEIEQADLRSWGEVVKNDVSKELVVHKDEGDKLGLEVDTDSDGGLLVKWVDPKGAVAKSGGREVGGLILTHVDGEPTRTRKHAMRMMEGKMRSKLCFAEKGARWGVAQFEKEIQTEARETPDLKKTKRAIQELLQLCRAVSMDHLIPVILEARMTTQTCTESGLAALGVAPVDRHILLSALTSQSQFPSMADGPLAGSIRSPLRSQSPRHSQSPRRSQAHQAPRPAVPHDAFQVASLRADAPARFGVWVDADDELL